MGLASAEAQRRRAEFGPNHVEAVGRERLLLRFAREFTHFFAIILFFAQYAWRALRYRQYGLFMPWDTLRCIARISPHDRAQLLFHGRPGQG